MDSGLGIDEFVLVQGLAPVANEAPEFIIVILLVWRARANSAMGVLLSSPLSQWTLLLASLPLVYFAHGMVLGDAGDLMLDSRQRSELLLTGAQAIFGVVALARLRFSWPLALVLASMFLAQLILGIVSHDGSLRFSRDLFSLLYLALAVGLLLGDRGRLRILGRLIADGLGISKKIRSVAPGPLE